MENKGNGERTKASTPREEILMIVTMTKSIPLKSIAEDIWGLDDKHTPEFFGGEYKILQSRLKIKKPRSVVEAGFPFNGNLLLLLKLSAISTHRVF